MIVILAVVCVRGTVAQTYSPGKTDYFVDQKRGKDGNSGTSIYAPWRTLDRLNEVDFQAGDTIYLAGGQTFEGTVVFRNLEGMPDDGVITITSAGRKRAIVNGAAKGAFVIENSTHVKVSNLTVKGDGRKTGNRSNGIYLALSEGVTIADVDVNGFLYSGIHIASGKNIRLMSVHAFENGYAGISAGPSTLERTVENLHISRCIAENNPGCPKIKDNHSGNGIIVGGVKGGLIENSLATNNGWDMPRNGNGPVGILAWNSDQVTIQFCISHSNKTSETGFDGGGFDLDGGVTNSILQYNLSYNNEGPGYALYQFATAPAWQNNTVRYNISINDGRKNSQAGIHIWAANNKMAGAQIYNNTILNLHGYAVAYSIGQNSVPEFRFKNNIFYSNGKGGLFVVGNRSGSRYLNNLYWSSGMKTGKNARITFDPQAVVADPLLQMPDLKAEKLLQDKLDPRTFQFLRLKPDSPCIQAGTAIKNPGENDFFGNRLESSRNPAIGAHDRPK